MMDYKRTLVLGYSLSAILLGGGVMLTAPASAAPLVMEGDYVRVGIGLNGTLGYGGITPPGLQHDPTGTGNWGIEDYLTPGSPWEWFGA
ncbi:hypothetical protein ECTPHS_13803, partial [Ectothiorhodospira sp. PHS-1]